MSLGRDRGNLLSLDATSVRRATAVSLIKLACLNLASCTNEPPPRVEVDTVNASAAQLKPVQEVMAAAKREIPPGGNDSASYIRRVFVAQIGEVPRLGWYASSQQFMTMERWPSIALYGPAGTPANAQFQTMISDTVSKVLRRESGIACESPDTGLAAYRVNYPGDVVRQKQALFTTREFQNHMVADMLRRPMSSDEIAAISKILTWPAQALRRHEIVAIPGDSAHYSIHQLFDQDSTLTREALILHGRDGSLVAYEVVDHAGAELCDGCELPIYKHDLGFAYNVENVFRLHGFAYPVLLLDTSTVEGRALSLVTFTPDRLVSEFRIYEYVVNCHRS
jgi:hypothetical protein